MACLIDIMSSYNLKEKRVKNKLIYISVGKWWGPITENPTNVVHEPAASTPACQESPAQTRGVKICLVTPSPVTPESEMRSARRHNVIRSLPLFVESR